MSNQDKLNEIVSVHLGKAGDGTVVKPYVTPDDIDASLLVPVPRHLNRTAYGIEENDLPFYGDDAWNAYEFSTLTKNGFPVSGWLKFSYPANTPNIVESKSVKLYLNSFNMARVLDDPVYDLWRLEERIQQDIGRAVGCDDVSASIFIGDVDTTRPIIGDFISLETYVDVKKEKYDLYNESPDILKVVPSTRAVERWRSYSLRSNCRVTNQPDWGDVYIHVKGDKTVTPESLLQYVISMRRENHFHEEICECIYKRLYDLLEPTELLVACLYTRRGGIDINPVRASDEVLAWDIAPIVDAYKPCTKTPRQ